MVKDNLHAVGFHVSVHHGIDGEGGHRLDAQLFGNVLAVRDDRGEADVEPFGYLLVDAAFGKEHQHFDFAGRKVVRGGVQGR